MSPDRRRFLQSLAGGLVGGPPALTGARGLLGDLARGSEDAPAADPTPLERPLDVALFFDVEDVFSPPEIGNDDSIKELATILTEEGLRGNFLFIGDRALLLRSRGRRDVVDSLAAHEVGLHTRSARHPTTPEFVEGKSWEEALALCLAEERAGAEIIRDVFDTPYAVPDTRRSAFEPRRAFQPEPSAPPSAGWLRAGPQAPS